MKDDTIDCAAKGGCEPVKELKNRVDDKEEGLSALNKNVRKRVSWASMAMIAGMFAVSGILLIMWFADIKIQAQDYPKTKEIIMAKQEKDSERIARLEEKFTAIDKLVVKIEQAANKMEEATEKLEKQVDYKLNQ